MFPNVYIFSNLQCFQVSIFFSNFQMILEFPDFSVEMPRFFFQISNLQFPISNCQLSISICKSQLKYNLLGFVDAQVLCISISYQVFYFFLTSLTNLLSSHGKQLCFCMLGRIVATKLRFRGGGTAPLSNQPRF